MPDITMCSNKLCSQRHECYRYRAVPSRWQSYSYFNEEGCDAKMSIEGDRVRETECVDEELNWKIESLGEEA